MLENNPLVLTENCPITLDEPVLVEKVKFNTDLVKNHRVTFGDLSFDATTTCIFGTADTHPDLLLKLQGTIQLSGMLPRDSLMIFWRKL